MTTRIACGVRAVDEVEEVLALVAVPARSGRVEGSIGIDADGEVIDGGEPGQIELCTVGERPVGGEAEDLVRREGRLVGHRGRRRRGRCAGRRRSESRGTAVVEAARDGARSARARRNGQVVRRGQDRIHQVRLRGLGRPALCKDRDAGDHDQEDRHHGHQSAMGSLDRDRERPRLGVEAERLCEFGGPAIERAAPRLAKSDQPVEPFPALTGKRHGDKVLGASCATPRVRSVTDLSLPFHGRVTYAIKKTFCATTRPTARLRRCAPPVRVQRVIRTRARQRGVSRIERSEGERGAGPHGARPSRSIVLRCAAVVQLFHGEQLAFEKMTGQRVLTPGSVGVAMLR